MRFGGKRALSASQQFLLLQRNPICAGSGILRAGTLVWWYWAKPTPLSRAYLIRLEFAESGSIAALVEDPSLPELAAGRRIPHVYGEAPLRLCLYLPLTGEFELHMRLDETIVPWTYLWLGYFEEWLWSNDWKGGGMHPEPSKRRGRRTAA